MNSDSIDINISGNLDMYPFHETSNINSSPNIFESTAEVHESILHQEISTISTTIEDKELNGLLQSWNLEHLLDFFTSEKITIAVLKVMQHHHIPMLFKNQKMGDMILFEHHLKEWTKLHSITIQDIIPQQSKSWSQCSSQLSSSYTVAGSPHGTNTPDISLGEILNQNKKSQTLTDYYTENSRFECHHRSLLINIICHYFEEKDIHMTLGMSYKLEEEILDRFPTEKLNHYRTSKRGKIYVKFCNSKLNRKDIKRKANTEVPEESATISEAKVLCSESNAVECVRSLRHDHLNAQDFDICWQACCHFRINEIKKASSSLEIFKLWPEYKKPSGFRYIDKDFGVLFGNRAGVLENWPKHFVKIKGFLLNNLRDKAMKDILVHLDDSQCSNDSAAVKLMWCIHGYFIPPITVVKENNKKSFVKHTVRNSQNAFLFIGNSAQHISDHIHKLASEPGYVQPFILAIGKEDLTAFENFFVYLDAISFQFPSFLRALDICFKCFHLFNLEYPPACVQFWNFIECYFYQMKTSKKSSSKVSVMTEQLRDKN